MSRLVVGAASAAHEAQPLAPVFAPICKAERISFFFLYDCHRSGAARAPPLAPRRAGRGADLPPEAGPRAAREARGVRQSSRRCAEGPHASWPRRYKCCVCSMCGLPPLECRVGGRGHLSASLEHHIARREGPRARLAHGADGDLGQDLRADWRRRLYRDGERQ